MIEYVFLYFVFGLAIGSFVNVLVLRIEKNQSILGRSKCGSCDKKLGVLDLVPVFSYLATRGKCRHCSSCYSIQYPIVELTVGILYAFTYIFDAHMPFLILTVIPILVGIAAYDFKFKLIPDVLSLPLIVISLITILFNFSWSFLISGPLFALPFFLIWYASKGRAMGFGDVILGLHIGWLVNITGIVAVFLFSFWIATLFVLGVILIQKYKHMSIWGRKTEIPFGPFMIMAALLHVFFDLNKVLDYIFL